MAISAQTCSLFAIPTIDISSYLRSPSSLEAQRVVDEVKQACTTSGFFQIVGHGISPGLQRDVLRAAEVLFALPQEEKMKLRPAGDTLLKNRGYEVMGAQRFGARSDLKEGYFISQNHPASSPQSQKHPVFIGPNIFPDNVSDGVIKIPTETYYEQLFGLTCKVIEMLAKGLPYGEDVFVPFVAGDPACFLRLLHYPPQDSTDELQFGIGAHTDFGAITLLLQDPTGGLEVYDRGSDTWHAVEPNPDSYVVNIGDMLSLWTGNAYKSTLHRVVNRSGKHRYSVPFFFDGNLEVRLSPLDGSGDDGKAKTVEDHMLERLGTTYGRGDGGKGED